MAPCQFTDALDQEELKSNELATESRQLLVRHDLTSTC
jgi:hypothetical protein